MEVIYSEKAQRDIAFWKKSGNKSVMKKITALIENIVAHRYQGLGKPEALKFNLTGL
nr:type II toxin-antitoxin system YoeB family toxin [uncultured Chryseobacterium sp.]